ncbi:MAG TPA: hypothetical protein VKR58_14315 [Aquella sp.]|nr:hypothetical protein [Aquella sp.]
MFKFTPIALLSIAAASVFASDNIYNNRFQDFDNEMNIGYGQVQSIFGPYITPTSSSGTITSTVNMVDLEVERLFNNQVWVDVTANMSFGAGPTGIPTPPGQVNFATPVNYGFNGRVGYAFSLVKNHLQLTPYGILGVNNVFNSVVTPVTKFANPVSTDQYEYTMGLGARLEYRVNNTFLLYADQTAIYNWDASGIQNGKQSQNNMAATSTLGLKVNLVQDLQLGLKGFWTAYAPQSGAGMSIGGGYQMYELQTAVGGMITAGLTY